MFWYLYRFNVKQHLIKVSYHLKGFPLIILHNFSETRIKYETLSCISATWVTVQSYVTLPRKYEKAWENLTKINKRTQIHGANSGTHYFILNSL